MIDNYIYNLIDFDTKSCNLNSDKIFRMDLLSIVSESLAEMAELKDKQTGNHINRVAILGELLAKELQGMNLYNLTDDYIGLLRFSIPLHDIGKVGIPDNILLKKDKLTADEFTIMQTHAIIGASILDHLHEKLKIYNIEYFSMASDIAKYHHEKYDGSGYPFGLGGDAIPISAQITALVDVFDALMSKRPYKEAYDLATCLEIIQAGKHTHFNPVLVDLFFSNLNRITEIYELLKD